MAELSRGPLQGLVSQSEAATQAAMQAHALASQRAEAVAELGADLETQKALLVQLLAPRVGASVAPTPGLVPGTTLSSQPQVVLPGLFAPGGAAPDAGAEATPAGSASEHLAWATGVVAGDDGSSAMSAGAAPLVGGDGAFGVLPGGLLDVGVMEKLARHLVARTMGPLDPLVRETQVRALVDGGHAPHPKAPPHGARLLLRPRLETRSLRLVAFRTADRDRADGCGARWRRAAGSKLGRRRRRCWPGGALGGRGGPWWGGAGWSPAGRLAVSDGGHRC